MSGTSASVSVVAAGEAFLRPPFTAVQWKELEHQALVYKYLVAGLPVPLDLVFPIRRSLEDSSARFFHHPSLGYASYYGKKFDHEPGRCRRTDGKKWRCSKDAYPNSKYCERHMNRGRHRSRKTVESKSSSPSLSTVVSNIALENCCGSGSISSAGCRSFPSMRFCSKADSEGLYFESNSSKMHKEPVPCGTNNKEYRYAIDFRPSVGSFM